MTQNEKMVVDFMEKINNAIDSEVPVEKEEIKRLVYTLAVNCIYVGAEQESEILLEYMRKATGGKLIPTNFGCLNQDK